MPCADRYSNYSPPEFSRSGHRDFSHAQYCYSSQHARRRSFCGARAPLAHRPCLGARCSWWRFVVACRGPCISVPFLVICSTRDNLRIEVFLQFSIVSRCPIQIFERCATGNTLVVDLLCSRDGHLDGSVSRGCLSTSSHFFVSTDWCAACKRCTLAAIADCRQHRRPLLGKSQVMVALVVGRFFLCLVGADSFFRFGAPGCFPRDLHGFVWTFQRRRGGDVFRLRSANPA